MLICAKINLAKTMKKVWTRLSIKPKEIQAKDTYKFNALLVMATMWVVFNKCPHPTITKKARATL